MINSRTDTRVEWICAGTIILIVATIPFRVGLNSVAIITALAVALAFGNRRAIPQFVREPLTALLTVYLLWILAYAVAEGKFSLFERSMTIVIVPFIFFISRFSAQRLRQLLQVYVIFMVLLVLFNVVYTVFNYPDVERSLYEFSAALANFRYFPTNYVAMYASFACVILFDSFFAVRLFANRYAILFLVLLIGYLMMLGSRTAFFTSICIMMVRVALIVFRTRNMKTALLAGVFVVVAVVPVIFVPYFRERIVTLYTVGFHADARYYEYAAAAEVFKREPWLGHGHYGSEEEMLKEFKRIGFAEGIDHKYNAHSEFLQALIDFGIPGFLLVCGIFVLSFRAAIRTGYFLPVAFTVFFLLCAVTESLLVRNRGITFYALFAGALLVRPELIKAYYEKKY